MTATLEAMTTSQEAAVLDDTLETAIQDHEGPWVADDLDDLPDNTGLKFEIKHGELSVGAANPTDEHSNAIGLLLDLTRDAAHGVDVDSDAAKQAVEIGTVFLTELRQMGT